MKKKKVTKVMCIIVMMALLLSGLHIPVAEAASTEKCPTIGNSENLADVADTSFGSGENQETIDLSGKVVGNTWYLSTVINFTEASVNNGPELVFATGTVQEVEGTMLRLQFRKGASNLEWVLNSAKGAAHTWDSALKSGNCNVAFETGKDYKVTIKVENGDKLIWWVNGEKVSELSLKDNGATNLKAAFGWRNYGASVTLKNIQVWDEYACPTIGNCENLVPEDLPSDVSFANSAAIKQLGQVSGNTWYISQKVNFTAGKTNEFMDIAVAKATFGGATKTIRVKLLAAGNQWAVCNGADYIYTWGGLDTETLVSNGTIAGTFELNKDYNITVQVIDGDELSFWINGERMVCQISLKDKGYSDLTPFWGYRAYGPAGTISNIQVWDGVTLKPDVYTELFEDISSYRQASGYTAPEPKKGYEDHVFAGWFTDEACTNPVTTETENVYAKFVTEDVLSVKAQLKYGTTASSKSTDYRFVTTVDGLSYRNIGFDITKTKLMSVTGTSVYKTILAREGEGTISYNDPTVFSDASEYFHTYSITGIPQSDFGVEFKVSAFWITLDGTKVNGPERTLSVDIGLAATNEG